MSYDSRLRSIGWAFTLALCAAIFGALTVKVNAVKSEVQLADRYLVTLQREKMLLETEFETRASQQQLANWNEVEFGYRPPDASQFLENERQLAQFGSPRAPGAPEPIRVARAAPPPPETDSFAAMVSPVTGRALAAEAVDAVEGEAVAGAGLSDFSTELATSVRRIALSAESGE